MQEEGLSMSGYERHCVFLNMQDGRFADISQVSGLDFPDDGRGAACVDWDHDGDVDFWLRNRTAPQLRYMRNDVPTGNHFLAIRLEGRTCNRDAIGARVKVQLDGTAAKPLIRTLRAGEGFLAQSSKWLHFGLGRSTSIEKVTVRWPGGEVETFTGLQPDHQYHLTQGTGEARRWTRPPGATPLAPTILAGKPPTSAGRTFLAAGPLLPHISYRDREGAQRSLNLSSKGPTLVNLWASWCAPCHREFKQWTRHQQQLKNTGLNIIALGVDSVDERKQAEAGAAWRLLDKLQFPFEAGLVDGASLDGLQTVNDHIFARVVPLAVPTSFLVDDKGRIMAVYRGTVDVDTLLEDVKLLGSDVRQRRTLSVPFEARWLESPQHMSMEHLAQLFLLRSELAENRQRTFDNAALYLRDAAEHQRGGADVYGQLAGILRYQEKNEEATAALRKAVELAPDVYKWRIELAEALVGSEQFAQTAQHCNEALRINPGSSRAHALLGNSLVYLQQPDRAHRHFLEAVRLSPENPEWQRLLGALLNQKRDPAAIVHLKKSIELRPDNAHTRMNLGDAFFIGNMPNDGIAQYQKAIELATAEGNVKLADYLRGRLQQQ
ncbi:MAG: ASPIC/UnbV domain-containing protein [Lentisphaeria bacterium]|jgi:tetratricopeptide (TPR) repeat protein|nr:ASPIC/UnbV domain-containing protein [Lentisphaeria bacterium]